MEWLGKLFFFTKNPNINIFFGVGVIGGGGGSVARVSKFFLQKIQI